MMISTMQVILFMSVCLSYSSSLLLSPHAYSIRGYSSRATTAGLHMAPPSEEPNQPPKRETSPIMIPTVGLGKDQVWLGIKLLLLNTLQIISQVFFVIDCIT